MISVNGDGGRRLDGRMVAEELLRKALEIGRNRVVPGRRNCLKWISKVVVGGGVGEGGFGVAHVVFSSC